MNIYGIDIGASIVKIAVVEKKLRGHAVKRLKAFPAGGEPSVLKEALAELGFDPAEDAIAVVFPKDRVSTRVIRMPFDDAKKIAESLPFEIESAAPFDAENMVIGHQIIRNPDGGTEAVAAFARKPDFERFLETITQYGADPDYVMAAPFSLCSAVADDGIIVDIGTASALIAVTRSGAPVLAHLADFGAETRPEPLSAKLAREIKIVMSGAQNEGVAINRPIVWLCGGGAANGNMEAAISEKTGFAVKRVVTEGDGAPSDLDGLRERWGKPPIFTQAIGAALIAARDPDTRMNFRTGSHKKSGGAFGAKKQAALTAILAAVLVLSWAGAYLAEGFRLDGKYNSLKNELRAEFKKALPEVTNIVSEITQLKTALSDLEAKSAALGPALAISDPFLDRFAGVTDAVPSDTKVDITEFTYEWDKILLSGRTESFEKVEQFRANLENLEWIEKSVVEGAKTGLTEGGVEFKISVNVSR